MQDGRARFGSKGRAPSSRMSNFQSAVKSYSRQKLFGLVRVGRTTQKVFGCQVSRYKKPRSRRLPQPPAYRSARVGADGRKVGHSFSKGVVDLYQGVIADPTNSGVSLRPSSVTSTPTADYTRVHLNLSARMGLTSFLRIGNDKNYRADRVQRCFDHQRFILAAEIDERILSVKDCRSGTSYDPSRD